MGKRSVQPDEYHRQLPGDEWGFIGPCRNLPWIEQLDQHAKFHDLARAFGFPHGIPLPPKNHKSWKRAEPDQEVMRVIRLAAAYIEAVAAGTGDRAWAIHQQMRGLLEAERAVGAEMEREARTALMADASRQVGAELIAKASKALVYFIQDGHGNIKIGMATDVQKRIGSLQTSHPTRLSLLATTTGGRKQERDYHAIFAEHRLHGEWFSPAPEILAEIKRLQHPQNGPMRAGSTHASDLATGNREYPHG